ncbi:growth/differentiation factor myoglianin [Cochliomyia hominivorax]
MDMRNILKLKRFFNSRITFSGERFNCILFLFLIICQVISTSTVDSIQNDESNIQLENLSNRIRDYTAKIFNVSTITYALSKNDRKLFLSNVFPSSFIFYTDETSANLINHNEILENHYIFKMPRNVMNTTKAQTKYNHSQKKLKKSDEVSVSEEDYFLEYDDNTSSKSAKHSSNVSTSASCSSCQHNTKAKKESLESIKKHILMRLQLTQPPNITVPRPPVPQKILDEFYKNLNYSKSMMPQQSVYKQYYNNKIHKAKRKTTTRDIEDEKRDQEEDDDSVITYKEDNVNNENIMINDNRYEYSDDISTSPLHGDEFYSRLHSIYVFPTKSRVHHNRKPEIFNFKFNSDPSRISSTILHVYIKGQNWLYEYEPDFMEKKNMEASMKKKQEIMIIIYRALRRPNSMNYTHTVKLVESRQKIPPGKGQWVEIEIKELSNYWMKTPNSTQSIVIRGMESWMRTFIVTEDQNGDKSLTMHIEIITKVKNRHKRNAALDCRESDNEVRCCRYPLKVNFTNFGWNFIVAPQHFDAYFCNGECNVGYLEQYTHTHLTSLSTSAKPCCSPQKLSPLALLYFDNNNKLMYSTIPNMSVEKCSCS